MTLNVNNAWGRQAVEQNQVINRWQFNVRTGCSVSINTGTLGQTDTLSVASGDITFNGSAVSVGSQNTQIDAADATHPRKDVVYLDSTGTAQVAKGTPEAARPSNKTGRETYRPRPPDLSSTNAVVLAEVWVPAGASSVSASDLTDRRLLADISTAKVQTDQLHTKVRRADAVVSQDSGGTYHAAGDGSEIGSNTSLGVLLQTVIDNLGSNEEHILLALSGTHTVDGAVVDINRDNLTFAGPGWGLTLKMPDSHNDAVFSNESRNLRKNIVFRDFALDENRTNQDGTQNDVRGIEVVPAENCRFINLHCFDGQNEAIDVTSGTGTTKNIIIRDCFFDNHNQGSGSSAAVAIGGNDIRILNNRFVNTDDNAIFQGGGSERHLIKGNYFEDVGAGIVSPPDNVNHVTITGNIVTGASNGIARFNESASSWTGWTITDNKVHGITGSQNYVVFANQDDGTLIETTIADNVLLCNGNISGVLVRDGEDLAVTDNIIETPNGGGIQFDSVIDGSITDNIIKDANDGNTANKAGILVFGESADPSIRIHVKNNIVRDTRGTPQQTNAYRIPNSDLAEKIKLVGNIGEGASGSVYNIDSAITDLVAKENDNYATQNSGTGDIGTSSTSVTVSHGLDETPNIEDITVKWGEDPTAVGVDDKWVSSITSSQFTINVDTSPSATLTMAWSAKAPSAVA